MTLRLRIYRVMIYLPEQIPVLTADTSHEYSSKLLDVLRDNKLRANYSNQAINYINDMNQYIEAQYKKIFS
jgi:hypothetical protein